ncbi:L-serine ammonia-lyase, iron-sulfur-dependent subunit beta [Paenibacillus sp. HB172176]|uniref:L-serine ammonia-lyase, iron-sulfur-dependent subunit beta n=1 Tax=Paenibacillus sp. HB172176 TaxID=2493690 RepID=UPI0014399DB7|nr:L-serine ammonia-lyase, iron-sulfur-dependent subunit beta [Paenibacillus sp. HB172176]
MRFKDVFSIIGPGMIGPSSSHTAGAVRIGRVARQLFGEAPTRAIIEFHGSFAETYRGHGTDVAIAAGFLDYDTDDERIPRSLAYARLSGMRVKITTGKGLAAHPNTARLQLFAADGRALQMTASSIGGGSIEVTSLMGFDVKFTGMYPTLVLFHNDRPGMIAHVAKVLSDEGVNIGYMDVDRKARSGEAITVIEMDAPAPPELIERLKTLESIAAISYADLNGGGMPE